jgi:hypothetical protein
VVASNPEASQGVLVASPEAPASTLAVLVPVAVNEAAFQVLVPDSPIRDQPTVKKQEQRMMMTMTRMMMRQLPTLGIHSAMLGKMKNRRASCKTICNIAEKLAMSWSKTCDVMACGCLGQLSCSRRNW